MSTVQLIRTPNFLSLNSALRNGSVVILERNGKRNREYTQRNLDDIQVDMMMSLATPPIPQLHPNASSRQRSSNHRSPTQSTRMDSQCTADTDATQDPLEWRNASHVTSEPV
eukprot:PhF_6_TR20855/c0_g1_i2/m.30060